MTGALSVESMAITTTRTKTETMYVHVTIVHSMNERNKNMNDECLNCVARKFCYYDEPAEDWTCEHREAMEQEYDKINGIEKEQEHE